MDGRASATLAALIMRLLAKSPAERLGPALTVAGRLEYHFANLVTQRSQAAS